MRHALILSLLLAATPTAAFAQGGTTPAAAAAEPTVDSLPESKTLELVEQRDVVAPAGSDDSLERGLKFNLDVSDDESSVSMQIGNASAPGGGAFSTNWQVNLTVPIEGIDALKPGSRLDLLSDGAKLTFSFSFLSFGGSGNAFTSDRFRRQIWEPGLVECERRRVEAGEIRDAARDSCRNYPKDSPVEGERYQSSTYIAPFLTPALTERMERMLTGDLIRGGIDGSVGFDKMKWVDPVTLAQTEDNKTQASGSVFFAWYPSTSQSVLTFRAEYQNGFEAQEEQAVCKPVVVDPAVDCVTGSLMPKHVERANVSIEYRRVFSLDSNLGSFAIAPKATYDTLSNEFEAEFPLYFIPTNAGPFSPGVEMRYSSKTDELTLGFFVRSTFKF